MKRSQMILPFVVNGVLLFLAFAYWSVESPAVPPAQFDQLKIGMTMAEAEVILGQPWQKKESPGSASWIYGHRLKWYSLRIDFARDGRISSFATMTRAQIRSRNTTASFSGDRPPGQVKTSI